MRLPAVCAMLFSGTLFASIASADIFRYVDRNGDIHYTNVPNDSRYKIHRRVDDRNPIAKTLAGEIRHYGPGIRKRFQKDIESAAKTHNVDPALIHAVISAESGYNQFARSRTGAAGLMQLMPETARRFGARNRLDPAQNIQAGVRYLRTLMDLFDNNLELVLAAYNAGETQSFALATGYLLMPRP